jgi:hypothetical protein
MARRGSGCCFAPYLADLQFKLTHDRRSCALRLLRQDDILERYRPSARPFNSIVEPFEYRADDAVRSVDINGRISFENRRIKASKALIGKQIALRPTQRDGLYNLVFRDVILGPIDLNR